ncbi:hypothetical protein D9M72_541330 [compost metagenome]
MADRDRGGVLKEGLAGLFEEHTKPLRELLPCALGRIVGLYRLRTDDDVKLGLDCLRYDSWTVETRESLHYVRLYLVGVLWIGH